MARDPSTPPRMVARRIPPIADTTAAMLHERAKIRRTEMPIESATCCESAVARMAMPGRAYLKNSVSTTSSTATQPALYRYPRAIGSGPSWIGSSEKTDGSGRVSVPQIPCTMARSTLERPRVTMITEMIGSPMSGRSTRRSSTRPRMAENAKVSSSAAPIGACALEMARKT